jgi:hypothetical protein
MDAEIHAVDTGRRASEGNRLSVSAAPLKAVVKRWPGLPLGQPREQRYIEVSAESWDAGTKSVLTARLDCDDIQRLYEEAHRAGLIITTSEAGGAVPAHNRQVRVG